MGEIRSVGHLPDRAQLSRVRVLGRKQVRCVRGTCSEPTTPAPAGGNPSPERTCARRNEVLTGQNTRADSYKMEQGRRTPDGKPRAAQAAPMAGSGEYVDLERFLSVLAGVRTVLFSGEFTPDGSFHAPYTGPGIHLLLGGDHPDGIDGGEFWATRVLPWIARSTTTGMALQRNGESCQMEYRIEALDGRTLWIRECSRGTTQPDGSVRVDGIVIDVTDQHARDDAATALEGVLSETRGRLDSVLSAIDEYLYAWRYPVHGPAVVDFESMPLATFLDRPQNAGDPEDEWIEAVHPDDRELVAEDVLAAQLAGLPGSVEYRVRDRQGRTRWLLDRWRCRREPGGVVAEGIVSDITTRKQAQDGMAAALASAQVAYGELEEARRAARRASNTDPLTGLANRRSFQASLDEAVSVSASRPFGLLLLDVDHFKRINDTHGHQAGDDVLVAVVACMRTTLPENAIVGALGRRGVHRARAGRAHPRRPAAGGRGHPADGARRAPGDAARRAGDHDLVRRRALVRRAGQRGAGARRRRRHVPRQAIGPRPHGAGRRPSGRKRRRTSPSCS